MSGEDMVMECPEDSESEVFSFRYVDSIVVPEEAIGGDGPIWFWFDEVIHIE
jgi:hypothetical protein